MARKVKEHRRERKFDGFLKVDEAVVSYEKYDGGLIKRQTFLVLERGDAAAALIYDSQRELVILTEQFRYPTYDKGPGWLIETVAGGIGKGETPEDCIKREILEEVGYEVDEVQLIQRFYVSPGGSSERIYLFFASVSADKLVHPGAAGLDTEQEDILRLEVPVREFFRALDKNVYADAKTIIAAQWLRRHRRLARRRKTKSITQR